MAIPRPKILSVVTIPSGGWAFKIYLSAAGGAQYDTAFTCTLAAGDYFIAGDNQEDDLLYELCSKMQTQIDADVSGDFDAVWIAADIDPDSHKVRIKFDGADMVAGDAWQNDVKIAWSESAADLGPALGWYASDATSTADDRPVFTAHHHHAYGWYSDEDGQIAIMAEDTNNTRVLQGMAITGRTKTQLVGDSYTNELELFSLERNADGRTKVYSDGKGYTEAPVYPYNYNEPLECWWHEARQGKRFRMYENGNIDTARANEIGTVFADSTTMCQCTGKQWASVAPQEWIDKILHFDDWTAGGDVITQSFYIESHNNSQLTVDNAHPSGNDVSIKGNGVLCYLFDHTYKTYVVDLKKMKAFAPKEQPVIDRHDINIPLLRYV